MAVNDLWGKMILGDIINHHDRLAQALGLYFATTFDLQRLFYKLQELKVLWTKVKVKQFSYFKTREIKVNKVVLYRFVDRFISVRDVKKNKNSNQKTRFVLFMFTAVDRLKWWIRIAAGVRGGYLCWRKYYWFSYFSYYLNPEILILFFLATMPLDTL